MNPDGLLIVSNNPLVWEHFPDSVRIGATVRDLLLYAKKAIAGGDMVFYAHPAAGNFRLLRNPFRSVVLECAEPKKRMERLRRDLCIIEDLLSRFDAIGDVELSDKDREDYAIIDLDLLVSVFPISENGALKK
ncbi:MAG: GrdX family protein [Aminobacteriaceae bacterium]